MIPRLRIAASYLGVCLAALSAQTTPTTPSLNAVRDTSFVPCTGKALEAIGDLLDTADTRTLFEAFGYDVSRLAGLCTVLKSDWLRTGRVWRLSHVSGTDDVQRVTLVQTGGGSRLWLIPIVDGMIEKPCLPQDPHNLAAFNALLGENRVHASTPEDLTSLAVLYLSMIGSEQHAQDWIDRGQGGTGAPSAASTLRTLDLLPAVSCAKRERKKECTVTINEMPLDRRYRSWELSFSLGETGPRLNDVQREIKEQ